MATWNFQNTTFFFWHTLRIFSSIKTLLVCSKFMFDLEKSAAFIKASILSWKVGNFLSFLWNICSRTCLIFSSWNPNILAISTFLPFVISFWIFSSLSVFFLGSKNGERISFFAMGTGTDFKNTRLSSMSIAAGFGSVVRFNLGHFFTKFLTNSNPLDFSKNAHFGKNLACSSQGKSNLSQFWSPLLQYQHFTLSLFKR